MKIAIVPGSFDPITVGHLDIVERAARLFDQIVVLVVVNPEKHPVFTETERVDYIRRATAHLPNITVDSYSGLLIDYMQKVEANVIVKGLRAMSDFEYEFQMALTNKKLMPEAETLFLTTGINHLYLSSSLVKQLASFGGDYSDFIPPSIFEDVKEQLAVRLKRR